MGAIAAAVNKKGENAVPTVLSMLNQLKHRGTDAHGVATANSTNTANSIEQLSLKNTSSDIALGHNLAHILQKDRRQPAISGKFTLVFEGRLFPPSDIPDVDVVVETLGSEPQKNAASLITRLNGSYAFAVASRDRIIAGRDAMGASPLYYGENETISAIASERKALWEVGVEDTKSFPPGNVALMRTDGFTFQPVKTITQPLLNTTDMKAAAKRLQTLLQKSVRERLSGIKKAAVAFSGGIDSCLVATLAKSCGVELDLIAVGLKGQHEVHHARAAATTLELPLHIQTYTQDDVDQALPRVLWLIEEPDVTKAGIAIPLFWTAEVASKLGLPILLAGQGADELFGGYQRYLKDYSNGEEALCNSIYRDIVACYENNFQRDNQACSFYKVELRLPFADMDVVDFSLALPARLKIQSPRDPLRKRVLRLVAQNLGMPQLIFNRGKKAIQYATGVNKALKRLARKNSLALQEYVRRVFREVYPKRNS